MAMFNSYVKLPEGTLRKSQQFDVSNHNFFIKTYPSVNIQKAMENGPFMNELPIKDGGFPVRYLFVYQAG